MKKKFQDAEKEAGGDEKLIFKFAWPKENPSLYKRRKKCLRGNMMTFDPIPYQHGMVCVYSPETQSKVME